MVRLPRKGLQVKSSVTRGFRPAHLDDQPLAHRVAGVAVDRMRPLVAEDARQPRRRAIGVERAGGGCIGWGGERDKRALESQRRQQGERRDQHQPGLPHPRTPFFVARACHIDSAAILR